MKLYLVRHAVAYDHGDPAFPNDDDRTLTPKGRRQFHQAAEGLLELIKPPAVILTSPLPRAAQTAEILQRVVGSDASALVVCDALRPGGDFDQVVLDCLAQVDAAARDDGGDASGDNSVLDRGLALVGHEPALGGLAAWLIGGGEAAVGVEFEKGGAARVDFDGLPAGGRGVLQWLLTPRILRRLRA